MDPGQGSFQKDITELLRRICANQERQMREVESMKSSMTAQDERLCSIDQELSSLTMPKTADRNVPEQSWTQDSQSSSISQTEYSLPAISLSQSPSSVNDALSEHTKSIQDLLEEERYFLRDQLGKAQEDIISRLTGLEQGLQTLTQSVTSLMERERDQTERETSQVTHQPGDSGQSQISLANTAQGEHNSSTIDEFRSVCRELETSIRAVTRAEIAWFDREVKDKLSTLDVTVNGGLANVVRQMESVDTRLSEELDKKVLTLKTELRNEIEADITETLDEALSQQQTIFTSLFDEKVKDIKASNNDLSLSLTKTINDTNKSVTEQQTKTITAALARTTEETKTEWIKSCHEIKDTQEAQLKSTTETVTAHILKCTETVKDCQKETNTKIETNGKTLTTQIYRSKMEQFSFVEKECQIIRDRQQSIADAPERKSYAFDFYVENFQALVKSGEHVYSFPWHVNQLTSSVQGRVFFPLSRDMQVRLNYGRHPLEVGLLPRSGVRLKVTATVTDTSGTIADLRVGEVTNDWDESSILTNGGWGWDIGIVSCQKLIDLGFGSKEKYNWRGAVLIRFQVDVL